MSRIVLLVILTFAIARGDEKLTRRKSVDNDVNALVGANVRCTDWELLLQPQAAPFGKRKVSDFIIRNIKNDSLIIQQGKDVVAIHMSAIDTILFRERRAETVPTLVSFAAGLGVGFLAGSFDLDDRRPIWVGGGVVTGTIVGVVIAKNSGLHNVSMADSANAVAVTELLRQHIHPDGRTQIPWPPNLAFGIRGGIAIPTGSYAQTSGENSGSALTGYSLGLDFNMQIGHINSWYTSALYSRSKVDVASLSVLIPGANVQVGPWSQIWLLTGMRFHAYDSPAEGLYGSAQVGAFFGSSPEARVSLGNLGASQTSSDATTFAGSLGVGWILPPLHVGLQYTFAMPEYDVTLVRPDQIVVRQIFKQPTTLLSVFVGVML